MNLHKQDARVIGSILVSTLCLSTQIWAQEEPVELELEDIVAGSPSEVMVQLAQENAAPSSPRESAPIDLTGSWVSVVTESWRWRMVTPARGDFQSVPINEVAYLAGMEWDPEADEAAGELCKAYGAARIMNEPGRIRISWDNDETLRVETDSGEQTRLLHFNSSPADVSDDRSLQGYAAAEWINLFEGNEAAGIPSNGTLKVVVTNLTAGYLRKNGLPYSEDAVITEYWNLNTLSEDIPWITITTQVVDPTYLYRPYVTSPNFKKEDTDENWDPRPCSI